MTTNKGIVDFAFLENMTNNNRSAINDLIELFKIEAQKYLSQLDASIVEKNLENIAMISHKAKSSFALMGMNDVSSDLKKIEIIARSGINLKEIDSLVINIKNVYEKCLVELINYQSKK